MKINILYGKGQIIEGYTNINGVPTGEESVITADPTNLDAFVDDAEAEDIIAYDVVNFLPKRFMIPSIDHWVGKLRHGGKITIGGVDCSAVARDIVSGKLDLHSMNLTLYGSEVPAWDVRKSSFTMSSLVDHLKDLGLKINKARVDKYEMIVEAIRP